MKEIDMMAFAKRIVSDRKRMIWHGVGGIVVGVIVALATPKTYTAGVLLAPEMSAGGLGLADNLAEMASSFGIELGGKSGGMDAIYPEIYPEVLSSPGFVRNLFDVQVRLKDDNRQTSYIDHLKYDTRIPFWEYPKKWVVKLLAKKTKSAGGGEADKYVMDKREFEICEGIRRCITCMVDNKTSVISIGFTDQDPLVAAIMADTIQLRLQNYITNYRTQKARNDYQYYERLFSQAQTDYAAAQKNYVNYCDTHLSTNLQSSETRRDELENDMQLAFNMMNQTRSQMLAAQAKIQERTPAYTVVSEAKMPHKSSGLSRSMIVLVWLFLSLILFAGLQAYKYKEEA